MDGEDADADAWEAADLRFREIGRELEHLLPMLEDLIATAAHLPPFFAELRACCLRLRDAYENEEHMRMMDRRSME